MLIKFSPFSATHRQQVYFPSTKQRKNAALTSYRAFSCFFLGGGRLFNTGRLLSFLAIRMSACLRLGAFSDEYGIRRRQSKIGALGKTRSRRNLQGGTWSQIIGLLATKNWGSNGAPELKNR